MFAECSVLAGKFCVYDEATQPPILELFSDTPVDLEAVISPPVDSAAVTAAILVPTVGATPTRAPVTGDVLTCETSLIDSDEVTFQSRDQPLKRDTGYS